MLIGLGCCPLVSGRERPRNPSVATTNLAGRTLRDLVQLDSGQGGRADLTDLPWVGHKVRKWESEPLRRLGVQGMDAPYRAADRREASRHSAGSSRLARVADRVAGRH